MPEEVAKRLKVTVSWIYGKWRPMAKTYRKMIQNLVRAMACNLIAIPVAAGLFVRWRIFP